MENKKDINLSVLVDEVFGESRVNGVIIDINGKTTANNETANLDTLVDEVFGESRVNGVIIDISNKSSSDF